MFDAGAHAAGNVHVAPRTGAQSIQASLCILCPMSPILKRTFCLPPCIVFSLTVGVWEKCVEITRETWREWPRLVVVYVGTVCHSCGD